MKKLSQILFEMDNRNKWQKLKDMRDHPSTEPTMKVAAQHALDKLGEENEQYINEMVGAELKAAIRHKNRVHQGNSGEGHGELAGRIVRQGHATHEDLNKADWGFTSHTGEFLQRFEAIPYALENHLFTDARTERRYCEREARAPGCQGLATQHLRGFEGDEYNGEY